MPNYHATSEGNIPFTTEEEAEWAAREAIAAAAAIAAEAGAYKAKRAAEYPPMADYIDGIVKGDQAQVQAYVDACLAVKAKYPKPNAA
jgi:hypothetical protein